MDAPRKPEVLFTDHGTIECAAPPKAMLRLRFYREDGELAGSEDIQPGEYREVTPPEKARNCVPTLIFSPPSKPTPLRLVDEPVLLASPRIRRRFPGYLED